MKKIFYYLMCAVVAMGAMACQNDIDTDITPNENGGEKVSFVAEVGEATRVAIGGKVDGKYSITLDDEDVLTVQLHNGGELGGNTYVFETTDGVNFSCEEDGVSELLTGEVYVYLGETDSFCSLCDINGISLCGVGSLSGDNAKIKLGVSTAVLVFESTEDVTLKSTDASLFSCCDKCSNRIMEDAEITIPASEGVHYVAVGGDGQEHTFSYSIGGVECKSIDIAFESGKLYNLGTLTKPSEWNISCTQNNWSSTANPMYLEGNVFVARNIELDEEGFKFCYKDWEREVGAYGDFDQPTETPVNEWYKSAYSTDGYKGKIAPTAGKYDIYLLNDETHALFYIATCGSKVSIPEGGWGICGSFTNWGEQKDIKMEFVDDMYIATDVAIPAGGEFKFRYHNSWNLDQKGLSEADAASAIKVGEIVNIGGDKNIKVATAGTYDIYMTKDFAAFAVVNAGAGFPTTKEYKIYVYNYAEWSTLNLYAWNSGTVSESWPGTKLTETEVINGHTYYVYTIPFTANDTELNIIVNNGSMQTPDYKLGVVNKDYYLRLEGPSTPVVITDKNNPLPDVVNEKVARTITVIDKTNSSKLNIYWWQGGKGWPGNEMTKNGSNYTYTFDKSLDGATVNMIFNNGSGKQTADITNIKLDKDYTFTLNSNWSYTMK